MSTIALFGKMLSFSRLKVMTDNLDEIKNELEKLVGGKTPIPVVLDSETDLDLKALIDMLWELGVQPIGVVEGVLTEQASELRLATFPADGKRIERIKPSENKENKKSEPKEASDKTEEGHDKSNDNIEQTNQSSDGADNKDKPSTTDSANTDKDDRPQVAATEVQTMNIQADDDHEFGLTSTIHNYMLRSGQSLQHLGGDLIVVGGVNDGAEAITDNNLHVYGRGLGRLVAGATGDKDARIFCQKFNPSLVSVAGTYCLREAIPSEMIDKAVQVSYDEEKGLVFTLITV